MRNRLSTGVIPAKGGWLYWQPPSQTKLSGGTAEELIRAVLSHRTANGLPGADRESVWKDIQDQLCERIPGFCWDDRKQRLITGVKQIMDRGRSFVDTMAKWALAGGQPVSAEVARTRANICRNCPKNVPWYEANKSCASCEGYAERAYKQIIGNRTHGSEQALNTCGACGCLLKLKVWIPGEALSKEGAFPDKCWLKRGI